MTGLKNMLNAALADPVLIDAERALQGGRLDAAERLLRSRLRERPTDVPAIRMMAELAGRLGRYRDAEALLRRALDLVPDFDAARANYVTVLHRQSKFDAALAEAGRLIAGDPDNAAHWTAKAAVLVRTGGYDEAVALYKRALERYPRQARLWVNLGHVQKTVGDQAGAVASYRRAVGLADTLGDGWWSLANLKTVRFTLDDIAAMRAALPRTGNAPDRYHLEFALGKALEDAGDYAASFAHYAEGNRLRRAERPYDAAVATAHVERSRVLMTAEVFAARPGGHEAADPIFVVGLPRSGSTLVEQILASHSAVEGTMELPDIGTIAHDLAGRGKDGGGQGYLPKLLALTPDDRHALGQRYLDGTRVQRKTGRPRFVDKMPNNFAHLGLIHLILPNAIIIDARRHPMATGFSAFKQQFSRGQGFTYDLDDLGLYYRDYVALMAHYDSVLPGQVYRVIHEDLVADPEPAIRALLDHCGLPFEAACLTPHATDRAVRTASSEQVRQPISADAVDQWRHYALWLGPLEAALGDTLHDWRD